MSKPLTAILLFLACIQVHVKMNSCTHLCVNQFTLIQVRINLKVFSNTRPNISVWLMWFYSILRELNFMLPCVSMKRCFNTDRKRAVMTVLIFFFFLKEEKLRSSTFYPKLRGKLWNGACICQDQYIQNLK